MTTEEARDIISIEQENSWLSQLCNNHVGATPVNLGVAGIGNSAAVRQLRFCTDVDFDRSDVTIILMITGLDRFDFLNTVTARNPHNQFSDIPFHDNSYPFNKWNTGFPQQVETLSTDSDLLSDAFGHFYNKFLWSPEFIANHLAMSLLELQDFCRTNKCRMLLANAFFPENIQTLLYEYTPGLAKQIDWASYLHNYLDFGCFAEKLVGLDKLMPADKWVSFHQHYKKLEKPSKYLTNCNGSHPTILGHQTIAEHIAKVL